MLGFNLETLLALAVSQLDKVSQEDMITTLAVVNEVTCLMLDADRPALVKLLEDSNQPPKMQAALLTVYDRVNA